MKIKDINEVSKITYTKVEALLELTTWLDCEEGKYTEETTYRTDLCYKIADTL